MQKNFKTQQTTTEHLETVLNEALKDWTVFKTQWLGADRWVVILRRRPTTTGRQDVSI